MQLCAAVVLLGLGIRKSNIELFGRRATSKHSEPILVSGQRLKDQPSPRKAFPSPTGMSCKLGGPGKQG